MTVRASCAHRIGPLFVHPIHIGLVLCTHRYLVSLLDCSFVHALCLHRPILLVLCTYILSLYIDHQCPIGLVLCACIHCTSCPPLYTCMCKEYLPQHASIFLCSPHNLSLVEKCVNKAFLSHNPCSTCSTSHHSLCLNYCSLC